MAVRIDIKKRKKIFINPFNGDRYTKLKGGTKIEENKGELGEDREIEEAGNRKEESDKKEEI